jgi:serine protease SohB
MLSNFLSIYGLFLLKVITVAISIILVFASVIATASKGKIKSKERIVIRKLNDKYNEMRDVINSETLSKSELKTLVKKQKLDEKELKKQHLDTKRIFVLNFDGDIRASEVENLREEITAVLTAATPKDEILVCVESGGGMVQSYGLAASQLQRIRDRKIPLTIAVDKVAASGGYMMACVGDKILAAPFAILGSIGVIAQLPNFNRFLKKHKIDYEQITAGEYKRTMSLFGENTAKGRKKMQDEVEETHKLFKKFV